MLRVYVSHALKLFSRSQVLKLGRIAIWNMHKIVYIIAMIIWMTDIASLIHGKYLIPIMDFL
jgi:hypothetical protein